MSSLAAGVSADSPIFSLDEALPAGVSSFRVGDELVEVTKPFQTNSRGLPDYLRCRVRRGVAGTTPASHLSGVTLSEFDLLAGGSISATDGQIVYVSGADAVGSASLTWNDIEQVLGITAAAGGHGQIRAIGLGAELQIKAADGDDTQVGGELSIATGSGDGNNSGDMQIVTGNDSGGGDSGSITISTGGALSGQSGDIDVKAGLGFDSAVGGSVTIQGGVGQTGNGGSVVIQAGTKVTGGSHGSVQIYSGDGNQSMELNSSGVFINGDVVGTQAEAVVDLAGDASLPTAVSKVNELLAALRASGLLGS